VKDATARRLSKLHTRLYRSTRGRIGKRLVANDMLLLTTRGRTSGQDHTVPLLYLADGEAAAVVVGTNFGTAHHPGWVYNLEADPSALLETERVTERPVRARRADHAEWARYWPQFADMWPAYDTYLDRTTRDVRMFVLEPTD